MKQIIKKTVSILLSLLMLMSLWGSAVTPATAEAVAAGDTVAFGTYPQTRVTDAALIAELEAAPKTWTSYNYMTGTGNTDGQMVPSDYAKFADFFCGGEKYRAVTFTRYRPGWLYSPAKTDLDLLYNDVCKNGYRINVVYYFKYEPLFWRVLDPQSGYVVCESLVDAQSYCSVILQSGNDVYAGVDTGVYANNYEASHIRAWLNYDFFETAFSAGQKEKLKTTVLEGGLKDRIYLISKSDAEKADYGFGSTEARKGYTSDYAKAQGAWVDNSSGGTTWWLTRTESGNTGVYYVLYDGRIVGYDSSVKNTSFGIRPACCLNVPENDTEVSGFLLSDHLEEGHAYADTPVWFWETDHSRADASFVCTGCSKAIVVTDSAPAVTTISERTCTTPHVVKYTATIEYNGNTFTETTGDVTLAPATGHSYYGPPPWIWADDYSSATLTLLCENCREPVTETDNEPQIIEVSPATCTADRVVTYTATVMIGNMRWVGRAENVTVEGSATGHAYGQPEWIWTDDHSSATATFVCEKGDDTQILTDYEPQTVEVSAATCTADRVIKYTAKVNLNETDYTAETESATVEGTATGHTWGEPVWTWAEDCTAAAVFTCGACEAQTTVPANVTYDAETYTYTATAGLDDVTYTDTKRKTVTVTFDMGGKCENYVVALEVGGSMVLPVYSAIRAAKTEGYSINGFTPLPPENYATESDYNAAFGALVMGTVPETDTVYYAMWNAIVLPGFTVGGVKCGTDLAENAPAVVCGEPDKYYVSKAIWTDETPGVAVGGTAYEMFLSLTAAFGWSFNPEEKPSIEGAEVTDEMLNGNQHYLYLNVVAAHYADETSEITETVLTPATATSNGVKQICVYCAGGCGEIVETRTETIPATGEPEPPTDPAAEADSACRVCGEYHNEKTVCGFFTGMLHDLIYIIRRLVSYFGCGIFMN